MLSRFLALGVRFLGDIEPQPGFARGFVRSMTLKAAIGKNRSNIAIILKLLCTLRARGAQKQGDAEKQDRTLTTSQHRPHRLAFWDRWRKVSLISILAL